MTLYRIQNQETLKWWAGVHHVYRDGKTEDLWVDDGGLTFDSEEAAERAVKQRPAWYAPFEAREYEIVGFDLVPTSSRTVKLSY